MNIFNLEQKIDRLIHYDGKTFRYFSGTAYLGMGMLPEFQEQVILGIERYGLNHGQSRGNNVRLQVFEDFESHFAQAAKSESAVVMSSGYLAGSAALQNLSQQASQIWVAPDTHPAILPQDLTPDPRQFFDDWKAECLEKSAELAPQKILILGNAVDPLTSIIHEYSWLAEIGEKHKLSLLIDDSHAFGVVGNGLFGSYASLKSLPAEVVVSGSLGKGLGLPAGIILCSEEIKKKIIGLRIFGGASPGPPGYLQAFLKSQKLYQEQKAKLSTNILDFHRRISTISQIQGSMDYPVFIYSSDSWVEKLEQGGFITSSFPYPTSQDPRINRIVISGFHLSKDLESLGNELIHLSAT